MTVGSDALGVRWEDEIHMAHAARVGRRGLGRTGENPSVGCVVVQGGDVVGVGVTQPGGRPHGEPQALAMAGERARGATAYVTLEPCCHHGKSPPCVEALVAAGVGRVVVAIEDPDPRVSGGGVRFLRERGISVTVGVCAHEVEADLAGFLKRIGWGMPEVTLKLAVCRNEKIARRWGEATAITGARAQARSHALRAQVDAILVGKGTVLADNPSLTCRLPGLLDCSPVRVVLDRALSLPYFSGLNILDNRESAPLWVMTGPRVDLEKKARLEGMGVCVLDVLGEGGGGVEDWEGILKALGARGVNSLLIEGGAHVATTALGAGQVDRVMVFRARDLSLGEDAVPALLGAQPLAEVLEEKGFLKTEEGCLGDDRLETYRRCRV